MVPFLRSPNALCRFSSATLMVALVLICSRVSEAAPVKVKVAADGSGDTRTVQAGVDKLPAAGGVLVIAPGTYRERVWVKQSHVTMMSLDQDAARTVIVFDLSQGTVRQAAEAGAVAGGTPPGHATVLVTGDDFAAKNITFENDYNRTHEQGFAGSQAQALNLGGDRNILTNVRVLANQDTLYIGAKGCGQSSGPDCTPTRTYFKDCVIAGNVDFIYGDGKALFEGCEIRSTAHAAGGYLTAQGKHYADQDSAFVFDHCRLTADDGVPDGLVFLGRPWKDYAATIFLNTTMGKHIAPAGWREWHPGETHKLDTAYYAEAGSTGPGAPVAGTERVGKQLTPAEVKQWEMPGFLKGADGWDPRTLR